MTPHVLLLDTLTAAEDTRRLRYVDLPEDRQALDVAARRLRAASYNALTAARRIEHTLEKTS